MQNKILLIVGIALCFPPVQSMAKQNSDTPTETRQPNIIYILADDLGYGELGCYGQKKIKTPNLDDLAQSGMRFTQHYSGSAVCACSRCVLLTGKHTGHAYIRANKEMGGWGPNEPEGQLPIPGEEVTLAEILKQQGYATACIGKWGLGGPGSTGHPCFQGFDLFYGYLCQRVAHNYYPTHLWHNHDVDVLGNRQFPAHQKIDAAPSDESHWCAYSGNVYAPDRMIGQALEFITANREKPFFLYFATPVPHVAIQVPDDSLSQYAGQFDDQPYLGQNGYLPHLMPRAGYAAMITRMDRDIGRILERIRELNLEKDTFIMFSSDNGPTYNGGTDAKFFNSAGPLRGLKGSLWEGGIRVPMIASWPGNIPADSTSDLVSGFQDVLPSICEVAGAKIPSGLDGISMIPTLLGQNASNPQEQKTHEYLYWELLNQQAVRSGNWKMYRTADKNGKIKSRLFNLADDIGEQDDLSETQTDQFARLLSIAKKARFPSEQFPSPFDRKD